MTFADITLAVFTICNSIRIVAYVPQITKAATDQDGAQAISFTTWGLFLVSNSSAVAYALVNKADWMLASMFLAKGELIDEEGTVYQGEKEIKDLLTAFFKKFPGTKLAMDIESVRIVGPVAIEEGTRTMKAKDGETQSKFRYITVRAKTDEGWKIASLRDFSDDPEPSPNEYLQSVAWLVGDWMNEGADGVVKFTYKWSEDKNYILGEFQLPGGTGPARKLSQRIGWDAGARKVRSWLFESDGGFADGHWTVLDDGIVAKYSSVNADGTTASATITISQKDKDRFSMKGTDRIVGDDREPDFEINVVRRPPVAGK